MSPLQNRRASKSDIRHKKASSCLQDGVFLLYSPCGEFYSQVRDISFGRGMRFAHWKLQGEYNITVSGANNITFAKQKYHAERERSISLNSLQLITFVIYYIRGDDNGGKHFER